MELQHIIISALLFSLITGWSCVEKMQTNELCFDLLVALAKVSSGWSLLKVKSLWPKKYFPVKHLVKNFAFVCMNSSHTRQNIIFSQTFHSWPDVNQFSIVTFRPLPLYFPTNFSVKYCAKELDLTVDAASWLPAANMQCWQLWRFSKLRGVQWKQLNTFPV